jgi:hypothetical protein
MRNITATFLIATSALIIVAIACSSNSSQTRDEQQVGSYSLIADQYDTIASTLDQVPLADCELQIGGTQPLESWAKTPEEEQSLYEWTLGQTNTGSPPLDPETATLEQILERSRLAMGDIVTYKTCGISITRNAIDQDPVASMHSFGVFHSYDHYRTVTKHQHEGELSDNFTELIAVGTQHFMRSHNRGWEEGSKPSRPTDMQPSPPSMVLAGGLHRDDIKLISTSEVAHNGENVFRLEYSRLSEPYNRDRIVYDTATKSRTDALLISQETFRIVTHIQDQYSYEPASDGSNGKTAREAWWWHNAGTTHYYEYNFPVVITAPDDYIPWQETVMAR